MNITKLAAALAFAVPAVLSAQSTSSMSVRAETTWVKGTVTGTVPTGMNFTLRPGGSYWYTIPAPSVTTSPGEVSTTPSSMSTETSTMANEPAKPTLDRKLSHGAKNAAKDASKLGKKAAHGVKEAASDVKKAVTGKP